MTDKRKIVEAYIKGLEKDHQWLLDQLDFPIVKETDVMDLLKQQALQSLIPIGGAK